IHLVLPVSKKAMTKFGHTLTFSPFGHSPFLQTTPDFPGIRVQPPFPLRKITAFGIVLLSLKGEKP
ncbi:MAG: hypothetical protein ACI4QT_10380, partial [Kiritimatiellia bacterium]